MRHDRLLIGLLLLATVLVDGAVLAWIAAIGGPNSEIMTMVPVSLALAQVNLAAIWAGLGKKSKPWRLTGLFLLVVLWSILLQTTLEGSEGFITTFMIGLFGQALFIFGPLSIARIFGLRVIANPPIVGAKAEVGDRPPLQFTLRHLFAWTTATAIVLGTSQYVVRRPAGRITLPELLMFISILGLCNAAIAFSTIWGALGSRSSRMVPLVLIAVVVAASPRIVGPDPSYPWPVTLLYVLETSLLLASLWVFRVAGYRLAWVRRQNPALPT